MKKLFGIFNVGRHLNVVNQSGSVAGGRIVRWDMCGGDLHVANVEAIADGSYIGGDLKINTASATDGDAVLQKLAKLELKVGGRIFVNGSNVTAEYDRLRARPHE